MNYQGPYLFEREQAKINLISYFGHYFGHWSRVLGPVRQRARNVFRSCLDSTETAFQEVAFLISHGIADMTQNGEILFNPVNFEKFDEDQGYQFWDVRSMAEDLFLTSKDRALPVDTFNKCLRKLQINCDRVHQMLETINCEGWDQQLQTATVQFCRQTYHFIHKITAANYLARFLSSGKRSDRSAATRHMLLALDALEKVIGGLVQRPNTEVYFKGETLKDLETIKKARRNDGR